MDDLISRQAAYEVLADYYHHRTEIQHNALKEALSRVPTAEPRKGRWIKISPARIYECSECGRNVMTDDIDVYRWCHGCGARMEESE